jgi:endo-1,4-beta-xylanase
MCAGSGDAVHAIWADEYLGAMLRAKLPNVEMHIYANGVHGNGLKDRAGAPMGTWQLRFVEWFRDLGFLGRPGVETKAARDLAAYAAAPASTR